MEIAIATDSGEWLVFLPGGGGHSGLRSVRFLSKSSLELGGVSCDFPDGIATSEVLVGERPHGDERQDLFCVYTAASAGLNAVWFALTDVTALQHANFFSTCHGFPFVSFAKDGAMSVYAMARGTYTYTRVTGMDLMNATLRCVAFVDKETGYGHMPTVAELSKYVSKSQ